MTARHYERLAPLSGLLAVVLLVLGTYLLESRTVDDDSGGARIREYFLQETYSIFAGTTILWLGLVALMWFLGCLRDRYLRAEGGTHQATSLAFAGGIGMVLMMFAATAPTLSGAIIADSKAPTFHTSTADTLFWIGDGFYVAAALSWLVFMAASAVLILRTQVLPRWIGWLSVALAVALAVPPIGWAALLFATPIWLAVVSLTLYLSGQDEERAGAV